MSRFRKLIEDAHDVTHSTPLEQLRKAYEQAAERDVDEEEARRQLQDSIKHFRELGAL